MKITGIYKITNPTGRIYVGQSVNINKRWSDYRGLHNCSEQLKLYNSFLKHGASAHTFEILEECTREEMNNREKHYVTLFNSNSSFHLNIKHGGLGKIHSQETIEKIRSKNVGKKMSPESRLKMSMSKKGKDPWNKGKKGSQIAWNKGKEWDEKNKDRLRNMMKGKTHKDETKLKMSESHKGLTKSKEHIEKVAEANRGKIVTEETKKKLSESHKGRKMSEGTKDKIRQALLNHHSKIKI